MRNFLIALWRSAARERGYALINLVGLSVGFACCLLLALFLRSELTYDRHFEHHARIYRMAGEFTIGTATMGGVYVPRALGPMLATEYPQIEAEVRFTDASLQDGLRLHHGDRVFNWRRTYFAGESVFRVFSHKVLAGDPDTALVAQSSVAVSATLARTYFGDANPIGQLLRTDAGESWRITLVFEDLPPNTHLRYDALFADKIPLLRDASDQASRQRQLTTGFSAFTYFLMRPGFEVAQWSGMGDAFLKRHVEPTLPPGARLRLWLQPLAEIQYSDPVQGDLPTGNRAYLYGCVTVALFILLVAGINYTNLATARALRRARSVALRRILGASRGGIFFSFLMESVLYAVVAAVLGLAFAELALSFTPIGELLGQVRLDLSSDLPLLAGTLGAALIVGVAAGAYPAFYLSSWLPTAAFSVRGGGVRAGARLRESLVLLQFVMAVGVVAATLIMAAQMRYVSKTPLGFRRDNVVMVTIRGTDRFVRVPALAQQLRQHPQVLAVSQVTTPPGRFRTGAFVNAENATGVMESLRGDILDVGVGFLETMGIQLVAGRDFPADALARSREIYLVNETFVRERGWKDPIGRRVQDGRVIGVVRDFHVQTLREPILPLALQPLTDDPGFVAEARRPFVQRSVLIRVSGQDYPGVLKHIEKVMDQFDPGAPFEYTLLEDTLRDLYETERRMLTLTAVFAAICVLIASLGLFGLTAFATRTRAREIAMRKVLGASAWQVVMLLSRRTLLLIAVGGTIAVAVAWVAMNEWLAGFAYRVDVSPLLLASSVLLAAAVALGTVTLQSLRVARADPADTLRRD